ncbi:MAG: serine/threonine-protein phosphatase [Leptospiraceae bacterium]|nr:serine/threonine-protein phosphatase [Leptospiraceae bacterium]
MKIEFYGITNCGPYRNVNQDSFCCANILYANTRRLSFPSKKSILVEEDEPFIFAVADGMGGHEGGEEASKFALEGICEKVKYSNFAAGNIEEILKSKIIELHSELNTHSIQRNHKDMGTTLSGVMIYNESMYSFHVGDTRIYTLHNDKVELLTIDHSLAWEKKSMVYKHYLTSCLGGGVRTIRVDIKDISEYFKKENYILLTSDGLHEVLDDSFFEEIIIENKDIIKITKLSLQESLFRESQDNLTIVTMKFS